MLGSGVLRKVQAAGWDARSRVVGYRGQSRQTLSLRPEKLERWSGDPEGRNRFRKKVRGSALATMPVTHPGNVR